jgi:hypothetical protein
LSQTFALSLHSVVISNALAISGLQQFKFAFNLTLPQIHKINFIRGYLLQICHSYNTLQTLFHLIPQIMRIQKERLGLSDLLASSLVHLHRFFVCGWLAIALHKDLVDGSDKLVNVFVYQ